MSASALQRSGKTLAFCMLPQPQPTPAGGVLENPAGGKCALGPAQICRVLQPTCQASQAQANFALAVLLCKAGIVLISTILAVC